MKFQFNDQWTLPAQHWCVVTFLKDPVSSVFPKISPNTQWGQSGKNFPFWLWNVHMNVIYGHAPVPAKGGTAINSETPVLGVYSEKESMTAGKDFVTRMLISALLINMKKLERISMCFDRRVLKWLDIHITEPRSRQTLKTKRCLWKETHGVGWWKGRGNPNAIRCLVN